jgi:hypothetical protein
LLDARCPIFSIATFAARESAVLSFASSRRRWEIGHFASQPDGTDSSKAKAFRVAPLNQRVQRERGEDAVRHGGLVRSCEIT